MQPTEDSSPLPQLPPRNPDSHKGDFGRALLIGGSTGMAGAIGLAGMAAMRAGAGLVKLAVAEPSLPIVAGYEPGYMTAPLLADEQGRLSARSRDAIIELCAAATAVGLGPGLGRSRDLTSLVGWLYKHIEKPLVVDADGLNALAEQPQSLAKPGGPRILTPHPGEFARLTGGQIPQPHEREQLAQQFAARCGVVVVLKGRGTVVTDGQRVSVNTTGNPGMATGGTGDVLTGVITALLCQSLGPYEAARLGVYLHGLAGDLAAEALGQVGMIARDLIDYLPRAIRAAYSSTNPKP